MSAFGRESDFEPMRQVTGFRHGSYENVLLEPLVDVGGTYYLRRSIFLRCGGETWTIVCLGYVIRLVLRVLGGKTV